MKTGVCSRCGRTLPTQLHHDDRNPVNTSEDNLIELCDLCHAMEHHGAVIKWVRPAKIVSIRYGGTDKSYGFTVRDGKSIVIEGFIVEFPHHTAESKIVMEGLRWHRHSQAGRIVG